MVCFYYFFFFPFYYVSSLLGYFRIVSFQHLCGFSLLECSKMGALFGCGDGVGNICFSHPHFKPFRLSSLNSVCFITGVLHIYLPLERVLGYASSLAFLFAYALLLRYVLCSCFLWALILYRDSGSFVFPSFSY